MNNSLFLFSNFINCPALIFDVTKISKDHFVALMCSSVAEYYRYTHDNTPMHQAPEFRNSEKFSHLADDYDQILSWLVSKSNGNIIDNSVIETMLGHDNVSREDIHELYDMLVSWFFTPIESQNKSVHWSKKVECPLW